MQWELREVGDTDCTMDDSGVYVVIHRVVRPESHKEYSGERVLVRADLQQSHMAQTPATDEPIMSFIGTANNVQKHLIRFLQEHYGGCDYGQSISLEHASYIGYELHRAESDPQFVQD